jgi:prephenate dehydrogenase|tara:strand:+ start:1057 stop:1785 length:729 start_codon:yes stop_codon:yes gene_type:complete
MKIGIIGFGRFGKLATRYLAKDFDVSVSTRSSKDEEIKKLNAKTASLEDVCKKDIVIICVPISSFEEELENIKNFIGKKTLVIDVCSVKEYPVELMKKILPSHIQILATHPIFGPDSAVDSLKGKKMVLCKVRIDDDLYGKIKDYLAQKELILLETTPGEHDKDMARSLFLTHLIGRSLLEFGSKNQDVDTEGYQRLLSILKTVENDTWQLFEDMCKYNEYSKGVMEKFIRSAQEISMRLDK